MDFTFFQEYFMPVAFGICLCFGYILKNIVKGDAINGYIPAIMGLLGTVIAIWIKGTISPEVILAGLFSGLASTGAYEAFKIFIAKDKSNE